VLDISVIIIATNTLYTINLVYYLKHCPRVLYSQHIICEGTVLSGKNYKFEDSTVERVECKVLGNEGEDMG
jgi:hypothetical protein